MPHHGRQHGHDRAKHPPRCPQDRLDEHSHDVVATEKALIAGPGPTAHRATSLIRERRVTPISITTSPMPLESWLACTCSSSLGAPLMRRAKRWRPTEASIAPRCKALIASSSSAARTSRNAVQSGTVPMVFADMPSPARLPNGVLKALDGLGHGPVGRSDAQDELVVGRVPE